MNSFWNKRYSQEEYAYGKMPNEFFKTELDKLKPGKLLLLGEGEGRNAVYAAKLGWQVDAFDFSEAAKVKALKLAEENKVSLNYTVQDLLDININEKTYDAIGIIYLHLHGKLRDKMHTLAVKTLRPNGKLIMELFSKEQIGKTSGGPKELELLYSLPEIENNFNILKFDHIEITEVVLNEGSFHSGEASVIRLLGTKL